MQSGGTDVWGFNQRDVFNVQREISSIEKVLEREENKHSSIQFIEYRENEG